MIARFRAHLVIVSTFVLCQNAQAFCETASKSVQSKSQNAALSQAEQSVEIRILIAKQKYGKSFVPYGAQGTCVSVGGKAYRCTYSRRYCVKLF